MDWKSWEQCCCIIENVRNKEKVSVFVPDMLTFFVKYGILSERSVRGIQMSKLRKNLLILFYVVLVALIIVTYPSMGSLILLFALIMSLLSLIWQRYINNRENGGFDDSV